MANGWDRVTQNRREFADMVAALHRDQLAEPSLCAGWTVRHVVAHLASFVDVRFARFALGIVGAGFDYDRAADRTARRLARRPVVELTAALRDGADKRPLIPLFPPEMALSDVAVHTGDVCRPLGLVSPLDEPTLRTCLDFLTTHPMAEHIGTVDLGGLRWSATDLEWSHGSGREVTGPSEALLMAIAGRPVLDDLTGDGIGALWDRTAT